MAKRNVNGKEVDVSIENQETAPIHGVTKMIPYSKVPIPSEDDMGRAKEWVDENQK